MADQISKLRQYEYAAMSNLVLPVDRSELPREKEPTGEAESLYGKIDLYEFGSRIQREKPSSESKSEILSEPYLDILPKKRKQESSTHTAQAILSLDQGFIEGLKYHPRKPETKQAYRALLVFLSKNFMSDQPQDVVQNALDEILSITKNDDIKDIDKKLQIERDILVLPHSEPMSTDQFTRMLQLSKLLTDYDHQDHPVGESLDTKSLTAEYGMAVVFEEDQEDQLLMDMGEIEHEDHILAEPVLIEPKNELVKPSQLLLSDIDSFWIQRQLSAYYQDANESHHISQQIWDILIKSDPNNIRELENNLVDLLAYDKFDMIRLLVQNRTKIIYGTLLSRASSEDERQDLMSRFSKEPDYSPVSYEEPKTQIQPETLSIQTIDLDSLAFKLGGHTMTSKKCRLPEQSWKRIHPNYEEIHIPAPKSLSLEPNEQLYPIDMLPIWAQYAFGSTKHLNRIQSRVVNTAFESDENMLICAPTGAGKTNIALLAILRVLGQYGTISNSSIDIKKDFKIVYIAPMKALVQEMVATFTERLSHYGIVVSELTGDHPLTKKELLDTQMIITTPEKWDVITRKVTTDNSYTKLVKLMIIDEIHLLHDDRGPVLEALVARIGQIRLVGLSATLPNYKDVAQFIHVTKGLYYFDASFRPCPLQQTFFGFTEKKPLKRYQMMNDVVYEQVLERSGKSQVLIFVHSRKETAKTAKMIRDTAVEKGTIGSFLQIQQPSTKEMLQTGSVSCTNIELQDLIPYGFAIHHAGLSRADRQIVEELFSEGHIQILVSTATLAWGVNLPAHTVIIKGTQVYSPERGSWIELSPQDILQMFGRAGRPQYDTYGEGILLTSHDELQYYLSLLNQQLPIESQFISKLVDHMNAEIVRGTILTRDDAIEWLKSTYLYIRMKKDPILYQLDGDNAERKCLELVHTAALELEKVNMLIYDKRTGLFQSTELGRIASYYYLQHSSMGMYIHQLKPTMMDIDILRTFSLSNEFHLIPVRQDEQVELSRLIELVPIPIQESVDEPSAKVNVLLQAYISRLSLEGFALMADMVYIAQSASRLFRAMFELAVKKRWSRVSKRLLDYCKIIEKRMWMSVNPIRQLLYYSITNDTGDYDTVSRLLSVHGGDDSLIRKLERKDIPLERLLDLSSTELGELVKVPKSGKLLHRLFHHLPRVELDVSIRPLTRSLCQITVSITPDFIWDSDIHNQDGEILWIVIDDVDEERLLYMEPLKLKEKYMIKTKTYGANLVFDLIIPILDPLPPVYYLSVIFDKWLHSETRLSIPLASLILPSLSLATTPILDMIPIPLSSDTLSIKGFTDPAYWKDWKTKLWNDIDILNPIQTQSFHIVYQSDESFMISSKLENEFLAELAITKFLHSKRKKIVYIAPLEQLVKSRYEKWFTILNNHTKLEFKVGILTGDVISDLHVMEHSTIICSTPAPFEAISRRWKQRKSIQSIGLFIADYIHMLGSPTIGSTYEIIISRMRFMDSQLDNSIRFVGLGHPMSSIKQLGEWIGASLIVEGLKGGGGTILHFSPRDALPKPLELNIIGFSIHHIPSLFIAMNYHCHHILKENGKKLVFVSSRKQVFSMATDLVTYCISNSCSFSTSNMEITSISQFIDSILSKGIGICYEGQDPNERSAMMNLFKNNSINVLIATKESSWSMNIQDSSCDTVVMMGTLGYDGREGRYIEDHLSLIVQCIRFAIDRIVVFTQSHMKEYYNKFLNEPIPMESCLADNLHDPFTTEVTSKTIITKQDAVDWLTWTFMYKRLTSNPNYYNLGGITHEHISEGLSEMVETTFSELERDKMIAFEENDNIIPQSLAMIVSYYAVHYSTISTIHSNMKDTTRVKGLLEILSAAIEFEHVPIHHHESDLLVKLYDRMPVKSSTVDKIDKLSMKNPHIKAFVLIQCHLSRVALTPELDNDLQHILVKIPSILMAMVDIASSQGWLTPALASMDLCQMFIQGMWDRDPFWKQLPILGDNSNSWMMEEVAKNVELIYDLMDEKMLSDNEYIPPWMSHKIFNNMIPSDKRIIVDAIASYPNIDIEFNTSDQELRQGDSSSIQITLSRPRTRNCYEENGKWYIMPIENKYYPIKKDEGWWIIIGQSKSLLAIKRLPRIAWDQNESNALIFNISLEFIVPSTEKLKLYLVSDAWIGCDQEYEFSLNFIH